MNQALNNASLQKIGFIGLTIALLALQWWSNSIAPSALVLNVPKLGSVPFLESSYLYWYTLLFTISFPLTFSWYKPISFYKNWKFVFPSLFLIAIPFIIWDVLFTQWGVWGFNPRYFQGLKLLELPLEECLFFIFIPYSCLFIYESYHLFFEKTIFNKLEKHLTTLLIPLFLIVGFLFWTHIYTATTFLLAGCFLLYHRLFLSADYRAQFYWMFTWSCLPFLIVNGILTGILTTEPVVIYHPLEYFGFRLITIPIDDLAYSFLLLLGNVTLYETLKGTSEKATVTKGVGEK